MQPLSIRVESASARPATTRAITAATGLDEAMIARVVQAFYARARRDPLLGPVFAARVDDWPAHEARLCDFWSSVALMTGRYHGQPLERHRQLPIGHHHFRHWLALFTATVQSTCPPMAADHLLERAHRIAHSLERALLPPPPR